MPDVLAEGFGVVRVRGPIAPEPLLKATEVVPLIVPAPVIAPEVEAVMVSTVPETFAPMTMPPVAVLAISPSVPVAVMVLATLIAPAPAALSVRLKLTPVDAALIVTAELSTMATLPVELALRLAALVEPVPLIAMPPLPADRVRVGVVSTFVAVIEPAPTGLAVIESDTGADNAVPTATVDPVIEAATPVKATVPAPENVTLFAAALLMAIDPAPLLEIVPVFPAPGPVMVRLLPLPLMLILEAAVALIADVPAKIKAAELIDIGPAPCTVRIAPLASVILVAAA